MADFSRHASPSIVQGPRTQLTPPSHLNRRPSNAVLLPVPQELEPGLVINKIEDILGKIQLDLLHQRELSITFRIRPRARRAAPPGDEAGVAPRVSTVRFPGSGPQEARKFARLLKLLQLVHDALAAGTLLTKRNIYYQDVELFGSQAVVDGMVDDLAFTLGSGRADLNVVAAGKGLVSGAVVLTLRDAPEDAISPTANGLLIPPVRDIQSLDVEAARWVLVVEKEATFRSLSASGYCQACTSGPGILITGKGYPDLSTRAFLHALHRTRPDLPVFAVVDFDPDGLRIMQCYKNGSTSLGHEENLQVPGVIWLGVKSSDMLSLRCAGNSPPPSQIPRGEDLSGGGGASVLVPLTIKDRKSAQRLLGAIEEDGINMEDVDCRRELQLMLFLGLKGEIQGVDNAGDLAEWLDNSIERSLH